MKSDSQLSGYSDNTFYIALAGAVLLLALAAGFVYWRYIPAPVDYTAVYQSLGIAPLPTGVEALSQIQRPLDQLNREPCYKDAIGDLAEALIKVGYPRESATSVRSFVKRCKDSEGLLRIAYSVLERISDYEGALEVADQLVKAYPARGTFRYWRATAYDHLDDFSHALTDYLNTVQLDNDPKDLVGDVFFRRKNRESAWDALSVVQVAAWHGELTFALMTFRMDRPHANPNPLGANNPLRFGNSSGKSGCPLWLGKIGDRQGRSADP
jgi:tetratricopeptide (TPR) repeat protein